MASPQPPSPTGGDVNAGGGGFEEPSSARSPSRGRLGRALSMLGAKIATTLGGSTPEDSEVHGEARGLGGGSPHGQRSPPGLADKFRGADEESLLSDKDRSQSRGRDAFQSSGRGGLGNIQRTTSASRDARPDTGPDDFSDSRGREPRVDHTRIFATGRGGAGNIRSPSRDVPSRSGADVVDQEVIRSHLVAEQVGLHSTGRGGIGNITGDRSLSRARDGARVGSGAHTPVHSTGRGGVGNIVPGAAPPVGDEFSKGSHHGHEAHSTGRGGAANITNVHVPGVEHSHHEHHHGGFESTGRGGAGNIREE